MVIKSIVYSKQYGYNTIIHSNSPEEEPELEKLELKELKKSMCHKSDAESLNLESDNLGSALRKVHIEEPMAVKTIFYSKLFGYKTAIYSYSREEELELEKLELKELVDNICRKADTENDLGSVLRKDD